MRNKNNSIFISKCTNNSKKVIPSATGILSGIIAAWISLFLLNEDDRIKINNGELHPLSIVIAVFVSIVIKNIARKLFCNNNRTTTADISQFIDCNDRIRLITVRYLIPSILGALYGLLLSFILTLFLPDDEVLLRHSSHLLSSGIAGSITNTTADLSDSYMRDYVGCQETRAKHTYSEQSPLLEWPIDAETPLDEETLVDIKTRIDVETPIHGNPPQYSCNY
jgi:hypothetical protein